MRSRLSGLEQRERGLRLLVPAEGHGVESTKLPFAACVTPILLSILRRTGVVENHDWRTKGDLRVRPTWKDYQEEVATFFRSIGCHAEVEKRVSGARGKHQIDVFVTLRSFGIDVIWIVECKNWKSAVPKEKVLAFSQVAQDLGADRGFLLSESGFQSGAIRMSEKSNITLCNIEDLRASAKPDIVTRELTLLAQKAHSLQTRLHEFELDEEGRVLGLLGRVLAAKAITLPQALAGEFPVPTGIKGDSVGTPEELIQRVDEDLKDVATRLVEIEKEAEVTRAEATSAISELIDSARHLIAVGEKRLAGANLEYPEVLVVAQRILESIKSAHRTTKAHPRLSGPIPDDLKSFVKLLAYGPLIAACQPAIDRLQWKESVQTVTVALEKLTKSAGVS